MAKRTSTDTISKNPIEDAERLRALFSDCKQSQAEFAEEFGIGSQAQLWQFLNPEKDGGRPLNLPAALGFARGLQCDVGKFSPSLQSFIDRVSDYATARKTKPDIQIASQNEGLYQFTHESTASVVNIMERIDETFRRIILDHAEYTEQRYIKEAQNSKKRAGS